MFRFIGHDNWRRPFPSISDEELETIQSLTRTNDDEVLVLRGLLFFYEGQKTTLGKLRENFTELAIRKFEFDKFIEIKHKT